MIKSTKALVTMISWPKFEIERARALKTRAKNFVYRSCYNLHSTDSSNRFSFPKQARFKADKNIDLVVTDNSLHSSSGIIIRVDW